MGLHCTIVFSIGTPEKKVYPKHGSIFVVVKLSCQEVQGGVCFCFLFLIFSLCGSEFFCFFISFRLSRCAAASNEIIARCSLMYSVDKEVRSAVRVCVSKPTSTRHSLGVG